MPDQFGNSTFEELQAQQLQLLNPPPPQAQSWGDIGKGLIAPLALGLVSSLYYPKYAGRGAGIQQGINTALQTWLAQQRLQQQREATAQRGQIGKARALGSMASAQATKGLQEATLEAKKASDAATEAYRQSQLAGTQDWRAQQAARWATQDQRDAARLSLEQQRADLAANRAAMSADEHRLRMGKLEAEARNLENYERQRPMIADALDAQGPAYKAAADAVRNGYADLATYEKLITPDNPGRPLEVEILDEGEGEVSRKFVTAQEALAMPERRKWTPKLQNEADQLKLGKTSLGGLKALVNAAREKGLERDTPVANRLDYWVRYQGLGGRGLPRSQKEFITQIDTTKTNLFGMTQALSGTRMGAILQAQQIHFPQQYDSLEQIEEKLNTLNLAMDLGLSALGYGTNYITDKEGVARAWKALGLDRPLTDPAEAVRAFEVYTKKRPSTERAPETSVGPTPVAAPPTVPTTPEPPRTPSPEAPSGFWPAGTIRLIPKSGGEPLIIQDRATYEQLKRQGIIKPDRYTVEIGR